ncbi:hypothetical protein DPMN_145585 [Dreissena polymorpha]|uniref:Uncharacterized protein n=1 Tax=Dreissena polymorpha TaxID=45954 RepID=A0A9D4IYZ0_DREPO|nr:hypothetical protein DPMN_145585 [Dreissena polymorpha]
MHGFEYLQNRDGLWRNWTTAVYGYEPDPTCPECGNSENLYCDMDVDPRRPEGVCQGTDVTDSCHRKRASLFLDNKLVMVGRIVFVFFYKVFILGTTVLILIKWFIPFLSWLLIF